MQRVIHHGRIRRAPPGREFDSIAPGSPTKEKPRAEARGPFRQVFRTALPALADFPDMSVEILADDAAMTARITIIISVAAIAGSVTAVIVALARANADADANRARAYPYALRIRRYRHRDTRRREKSDGKFLHKNLLVAALTKRLAGGQVPEIPVRLFRERWRGKQETQNCSNFRDHSLCRRRAPSPWLMSTERTTAVNAGARMASARWQSLRSPIAEKTAPRTLLVAVRIYG